jgi:hypothetical protein
VKLKIEPPKMAAPFFPSGFKATAQMDEKTPP